MIDELKEPECISQMDIYYDDDRCLECNFSHKCSQLTGENLCGEVIDIEY